MPKRIPWNKKEPIEKKCPKCGKVFYVKPSLDRVVHCSISCAKKGKRLSQATEFKKGHKPWNKGTKGAYSKEYLEKLRKSHKGQKPWNTGRDHKYKGEMHHLWKGGITPENIKARSDRRLFAWRDYVFERDDYTCQICGDDTGGNLEAHHIKKFSEHPKLRYDRKNGITLCQTCHWGIRHAEEDLENHFLSINDA